MPKASNMPHPNRTPPGVAHPIDVHVGGRVRIRRKMLRISQTELGNSLGLTFQQIQKYERGANRIGASRLYQIANILDVPVSFFFEDINADGISGPSSFLTNDNGASDTRDQPAVIESEETSKLVKSYYAIRNPKRRKAVHDLIADLAKSGWPEGETGGS